MKRRSLLQAAILVPAAAAAPVAAQTPAPAPPSADPEFPPSVSKPDEAGDPVPQFFTADQMSALRKLGALLVPSYNGMPGAEEAAAAAFLAMYMSQSPQERQDLYRNGLDSLNAQARQNQSKMFEELDSSAAAPILQPLSEPWTYGGPQDPFGAFLAAAKEDFLRATVNSRAYSMACAEARRRCSGSAYYWLPVE